MQYFHSFVSNTCAGSGNQLYFDMPPAQPRTGRAFYRLAAGGRMDYALAFSNIIDSTFADGSVSHCNLILPGWTIHRARAGRCARFPDGAYETLTLTDESLVTDWVELTFGGSAQKSVAPGEFFACDPFVFDARAGEFLCVELTFSGTRLPYHEESLLPLFVRRDGAWTYDRRMPLPAQIGCRRAVRARIGYLGDSITQGCGTTPNAYRHWNALLSEKIGTDFAFWNLGLGYGRASDAASDGAWLYKARQNDLVVVCYGVNDVNQGADAQTLMRNLTTIVRTLRAQGIHVVIQTIPPFDYPPERIAVWQRVCESIRTTLAKEAALVFDVVPILGLGGDQSHRARYGGHPDDAGCAIWADALYAQFMPLLDRLFPCDPSVSEPFSAK